MMPNDELSTLLQQLADPDPSARRIAAETLSDGDERAIYPLIRTLRDENPGVQDAAMRSLTAIGGEVTAYMALPLLRESPFLRNTARIILKQIGQPSVPLLRPLLTDKDDDVRTFAVDLITDIGTCDYPAEIARLLEADPNQNVRASAARAIGALGYQEGAAALVGSLKDNEWVCFSALEAIAVLRDEAFVEPVHTLLGSPSETLRYAAIETLGKLGSSRSSAALLGRLGAATDIEKTAIIRSLVQIGITPSMAEVSDQLIEMYANGDWEERMIALTGLSDLKDERAVRTILEVAGELEPSDPESEERLHAVQEALLKFGCDPALLGVISDPTMKFRSKVIAIEIIGELQCTEAVPHLIAIMDGDLREVRRASVLALAVIRGDQALAELRKRIEDRDGHVRNASISALGQIGDKSSYPLILDHIARENYQDVLEATIKALLLIDAQSLFKQRTALSPAVREIMARYAGSPDMLLALSRDPEQAVRLAALSGLSRFTDDATRARLKEALKDPNQEARKLAIMALGSMNSCFEEITQALRDTDLWVRLHAVRAIGESGRPEAAKTIIPLLYDKEVPVVLAAIDALVQLGSSESVSLGALQNHPDPAVQERVAQVMERL